MFGNPCCLDDDYRMSLLSTLDDLVVRSFPLCLLSSGEHIVSLFSTVSGQREGPRL